MRFANEASAPLKRADLHSSFEIIRTENDEDHFAEVKVEACKWTHALKYGINVHELLW